MSCTMTITNTDCDKHKQSELERMHSVIQIRFSLLLCLYTIEREITRVKHVLRLPHLYQTIHFFCTFNTLVK